MQPYAFPYLGYFQLIAAVDRFVILDDVDFIKRGWINRNVLADRGGPVKFTIPVITPKRGQLICTMQLHDPDVHQRRLLTKIRHVYHNAPCYQRAFPTLEKAISYSGDDLAGYLHHSLAVLADYLAIETPFFRASQCHERASARGQERIIEICRAEGANIYINPEGGLDLYDSKAFRDAGIELKFLVHQPREHRQNAGEFIPRLSIIDTIMFNGPPELARLLKEFKLLIKQGRDPTICPVRVGQGPNCLK